MSDIARDLAGPLTVPATLRSSAVRVENVVLEAKNSWNSQHVISKRAKKTYKAREQNAV